MTVPTTSYFSIQTWTGTEPGWSSGFPAQKASDVFVLYAPDAGGSVLLTQGVHYVAVIQVGTVAIVPLTMPAPPGKVNIFRFTAPIQETDFVDLADFSADVHEKLHDRWAMAAQESLGANQRTFSLPLGEIATAGLPPLLTRQGGAGGTGSLATYDAQGNPSAISFESITNGGGGGIAEAPQDGFTYGRVNAGWLSGGTFNGEIHGTRPGSTETNNGNPVGIIGIGYSYNDFQVTQDQRVDYGATPFTYNMHIYMGVGGGASRGNKYALRSHVHRIAPSDISQPAGETCGVAASASSASADGGTNTSTGARGHVCGITAASILNAGATNYQEVTGAEFTAYITAGASARYRFGCAIVGQGDLQGVEKDQALQIGSATAGGQFKNGISFSTFQGQAPIGAAGSLIWTDGAQTVANGIDFSSATITGDLLKGPSGFHIAGNGTVFANSTGAQIVVGGNPTPLIQFGPTSGATKIAVMYQQADFWKISDGTTDRFLVDLNTGNVQVNGQIFFPSANSGFNFGSGDVTVNYAANALTFTGATSGYSFDNGINLLGSTSGFVTIAAQAVAGTWTLRFPTSAGTAGQMLQTDGAGNTSWTTLAGGGNVSNSGTPVSGQWARWISATQIEGVAAAATGFVQKSGDTMTGTLTLAGDPAAALQAATKQYVDNGFQPLDADLTAIAALTATNVIYYRSAANTWAAVTIGSGLSFAGGVLASSAGGGNVSNSGTPVNGQWARWINANQIEGVTTTAMPFVELAGDTMTGALTLNADPTNTMHAATKQYVDGLAGGVMQCGRLVVTSSTVLTYKPWNGDRLKVNGVIRTIPAAGIVANSASTFLNGVGGSALPASTTFWVYVFDNAGTLALDFRTTGHATSTTAGNVGTEILNGDDTRSLVGMVFATPFQDLAGSRFVINWFNRRNLTLQGNATAGNPSTVSTTFAELDTGTRVYFLTWADEAIEANVGALAWNSGTSYGSAAVSLDGSATAIAAGTAQSAIANALVNLNASGVTMASEGVIHFLAMMGSAAAGTQTFNGGLNGMIRG